MNEGIMTEKEYIECADLRTIRWMRVLMNDVVAANDPHVTDAEYESVWRILHTWEGRLTTSVNAAMLLDRRTKHY